METTTEDTGLNFDMERTSPDEAEEAVKTSSRGRTSKYEPIAEEYDKAQANGESLVVRDLTENDVQNIRNLIYRRFDKEKVIVRSARKGEDQFNISIRERKDGEYLRDDSDDGASDEEVADEDVEEVEDDTFDVGDEDDDFEPSFE